MCSSFKHLLAYFGEKAKAVKLAARLDDYVAQRREEGAADASIRIELALLDRAFRLAVKKRLLSHRSRPDIEKPADDPSRVRKGFFRRDAIERLCAPCDCSPLAVHARSWTLAKRATRPDVPPCWHLPRRIADVVAFLFFCPWRVGAARRLEWRDYSEEDQALTLRPELNKTGHELQIPVDPENTPELMAVIERQKACRRSDCPFIFHGSNCGTGPRYDKKGNQRPCLGDFQKVWDVACAGIAMAGRIPHDLRRSGVKHYVDAGVDPHTVMAWSGHRTPSMLRRYHIIDLDDFRRAGKKASDYRGPKDNVVRGDFKRERTRTEPAQDDGFSRPASDTGSVRA